MTHSTGAVSDPGVGLLLNAGVSLGSGLLLTIAPGTVGGWLGVSIDGWLRLFGVALIAHAALLLWMNSRPDPVPWAKLNLAMIAPYPALMLGVVVFGLVERGLGQILVLADGAIIGAIALVLWRGLQSAPRQFGAPGATTVD